jgi:haloacetate dehalogenase
MAYGGGNWATYINQQGAGINQTAIDLFWGDKALETYHTFYDQVSVTNASVWDYWNAANSDYLEMEADQMAGRKIQMPTHVEYSEYNLVTLGKFNVPGIWKNFTDPSAGLTTEAVCCGQGHFIIELAPQQTIGQLNKFLDRLGVRA